MLLAVNQGAHRGKAGRFGKGGKGGKNHRGTSAFAHLRISRSAAP
jgi:hypothetical protein